MATRGVFVVWDVVAVVAVVVGGVEADRTPGSGRGRGWESTRSGYASASARCPRARAAGGGNSVKAFGS
jgi:hypothetical protein